MMVPGDEHSSGVVKEVFPVLPLLRLARTLLMVQADERKARPLSVQDGWFGINLVAPLARPSAEGGVKKIK